ncbi:unnamed protein product [Arctia plantaginis]|uniref:Peptidase S1 domain-containing protein n=1 Tax=Arctia plantaginis TaxID=874455 RepID=A0A8S1A9K1_ARCPL|nr:unnamed protein product [Arctia plantaginis]
MRLIYLVFVCFTAVTISAAPTTVTIRQWPQLANVLFTWNWSTFEQYCGGTVLSNRSILTAAHCVTAHPASRFRLRLGSTFVNSGGIGVNVESSLIHPYYNSKTENFDVALLYAVNSFALNDQIKPARIASFDYNLGDSQILHATGWGTTEYYSSRSEELAVEQIWKIIGNGRALIGADMTYKATAYTNFGPIANVIKS